jgi:hypothetical protein
MSEKRNWNFPPDFEVSYRFLTPEEGGRQSSLPMQGYSCNWSYSDDNVEKTGQQWEILPEFENENREILPKSTSVLAKGYAKMYILNPNMRLQIHKKRIALGTRGFFVEGRKKVAEATVTKIIGLDKYQIK